jgi:hypothetical protein
MDVDLRAHRVQAAAVSDSELVQDPGRVAGDLPFLAVALNPGHSRAVSVCVQPLRPPRAASLVAALACGCLLAGCTFAAEPQLTRPTPAEPTGTGSTAGTAATPPFGGSDLLFGPFRRGGVPVATDLLLGATNVCRTTPPSMVTTEVGGRPVVVADLRGGGRVLLVFADALGAVACRVSATEDGAMRAAFSRVASAGDGPLEADDLTLGGLDYEKDGVVAVGRVGERAVHVRAGFDDDTYVTATIGDDGWWAMWWPGEAQPASITADDNRNVVITAVDPRQP